MAERRKEQVMNNAEDKHYYLRETKEKLEDVDCQYHDAVDCFFDGVDISKLNVYKLADLIDRFTTYAVRDEVIDMTPSNWDTVMGALNELCYEVKREHDHLRKEEQ